MLASSINYTEVLIGLAERISFDRVAEAHRRLEAGGLEGKLVLCPDVELRRDPGSASAGAE